MLVIMTLVDQLPSDNIQSFLDPGCWVFGMERLSQHQNRAALALFYGLRRAKLGLSFVHYLSTPLIVFSLPMVSLLPRNWTILISLVALHLSSAAANAPGWLLLDNPSSLASELKKSLRHRCQITDWSTSSLVFLFIIKGKEVNRLLPTSALTDSDPLSYLCDSDQSMFPCLPCCSRPWTTKQWNVTEILNRWSR